ncbi:hypothetical protein B0H14DRAFT_2606761 [Mycena olivaceomarginata]|nr:hypothetical protein B0H14DRAFT_2606761 [Mycena olivaceomarginata]
MTVHATVPFEFPVKSTARRRQRHPSDITTERMRGSALRPVLHGMKDVGNRRPTHLAQDPRHADPAQTAKDSAPLPPHRFTRYNDTASRRPSFRYASAASAASTIVRGVHAHACGTSSLICSTIRMALLRKCPLRRRQLPQNKDEKDNEGEIDTFPEAFENIVCIAHDVRQWVLIFDGTPLLMADIGRDEQIKGESVIAPEISLCGPLNFPPTMTAHCCSPSTLPTCLLTPAGMSLVY